MIDCDRCPTRLDPKHARRLDGLLLCHWCWRQEVKNENKG